MYILSQNKEVFMPMGLILVSECNVVHPESSDSALILGTYATEERAKEVLQQIVNQVKNVNTTSNSDMSLSNCHTIEHAEVVFYMPEE